MTDTPGDLVFDLLGHLAPWDTEDEIEATTGRSVEDVALDYNLERCSRCGVWSESGVLDEAGICLFCADEED